MALSRSRIIPRDPLFRLLLINLAAGLAAAAILFGGLLLLNPYHLRDLILSDRSPETALILLLFGFVITFGSAAMGTAIMAIGRKASPRSGHGTPATFGTPATLAPAKASARARDG